MAMEGGPSSVGSIGSMLPPVVEQIGFGRQIVDMGPGTDSCKVYFGNFTSSRGTVSNQRGFHDCTVHGCIKCRVVGADSLLYYCARSYLWWLQSLQCGSKEEHLIWEPSDIDITLATQTLRATPF